MIVNIRGTSGSGKTTIVRGLMAKGLPYDLPIEIISYTQTDRKTKITKVITQAVMPGYRLEIPDMPDTYILGSYENVCGGCDGIPTQDIICDRARKFSSMTEDKGHVIMEGLLMSHIFARYRDLDLEFKKRGQHFVWAFMDTPLEVCLARVQGRRNARGATSVFNPQNTIDKWNDMHDVYKKAKNAGFDVRWVDHKNSIEEVFSWLKVRTAIESYLGTV